MPMSAEAGQCMCRHPQTHLASMHAWQPLHNAASHSMHAFPGALTMHL